MRNSLRANRQNKLNTLRTSQEGRIKQINQYQYITQSFYAIIVLPNDGPITTETYRI